MAELSSAKSLRVPRKVIASDLLSGFVMAVISVPGALANGVLAGVNPVFGLYSMIVGTTTAALFTSSVIMNVDSTSATAIATGESLWGMSSEQQLQHLVVLGILVGVFQLVFGLLNLGTFVRYISNAVMTGFLTGIGILTILGQVGDLTGYASEAGNKVFRAVDTVLHPGRVDGATVVIGLLTMAAIFLVERTRYSRYSYIIGLGLATISVAVLGMTSVPLVGDITNITRSLPVPQIPNLSIVVGLLAPGLAISVIALVQAAGVSQSVPNPDGEYPNPSVDFRGQGIANIATGFVAGIPVGGSLSGTTLIRSVGGRTRWANIFTGLFGAVLVLLFAPLIERLPMAALAGLLVMVGISMIKVPRLQVVWRTGLASRSIMLLTLLATLFLPIQYAVATGVALHLLLYVYTSAESVRIERILIGEDGTFTETEAPETLTSNEIVMLQPVGSLFFAGAVEFEEALPDVGDAHNAVAIVGLRDRDEVGSTFIGFLDRYADELHAQDNLLMLAGVDEHVALQLERTGLLEVIGQENIFPAQPIYGAALQEAYASAERWIQENAERGD